MNVSSTLATLRRKRVIIPAAVAVAVLGAGATAWSATAGDELPGSERDRVAEAAARAVAGTVTDAERSDDPGEAYEVEVRTDAGGEVDVVLDEDLDVVRRDADGDSGDSGDTDDRPVTEAERASAERAALVAVGGGTVVDTEASDDPGVAYEVEVHGPDGTEWDVELDAGFAVLRQAVSD